MNTTIPADSGEIRTPSKGSVELVPTKQYMSKQGSAVANEARDQIKKSSSDYIFRGLMAFAGVAAFVAISVSPAGWVALGLVAIAMAVLYLRGHVTAEELGMGLLFFALGWAIIPCWIHGGGCGTVPGEVGDERELEPRQISQEASTKQLERFNEFPKTIQEAERNVDTASQEYYLEKLKLEDQYPGIYVPEDALAQLKPFEEALKNAEDNLDNLKIKLKNEENAKEAAKTKWLNEGGGTTENIKIAIRYAIEMQNQALQKGDESGQKVATDNLININELYSRAVSRDSAVESNDNVAIKQAEKELYDKAVEYGYYAQPVSGQAEAKETEAENLKPKE